jgi:ATP-dependent Clp protease ATP-binding subunit ClpB
VDFRNTVVILTSNLGSHYFADPLTAEATFQEVRNQVLEEVRMHVRPEFVNRLDEIVVFRPLGVAQIKEIVRIQLDRLAARLAERRIELQLSEEATLQIATAGFDPVYGARPLKRAIQNEVMNPLAQAILRGEVRDGQRVFVDHRDGRFVFEPEAATV